MKVSLVTLACLCATWTVLAEDGSSLHTTRGPGGPIAASVTRAGGAVRPISLPDHPWTSGLYSTVTAPFCTKGVKPRRVESVKLNVPGFWGRPNVRAVIQPHAAPLVVLINGSFGRADAPMADLWMSWLEKDGVHVVTFDSALLPSFTKASQHGVAGNPLAETEVIARIIDTFIQQRLRGRVDKIGVVGMSYGATQALLLERFSRAGKLPFTVDAVQAYSPPVEMQRSLQLLDEYYSLDWKLSDHYWKFNNLQREHPMPDFDDEMMRAAIARSFRLDLSPAIEANDDLFGAEMERMGLSRLEIPKKGEFVGTDERQAYTDNINFSQYIAGMVIPYWVAKGALKDGDELFRATQLENLLSDAGPGVQVILAANDPLNDDGMAQRVAARHSSQVQLLEVGGHLGYLNSEWVQANLSALFQRRPAPVIVDTVAPPPAPRVIIEGTHRSVPATFGKE